MPHETVSGADWTNESQGRRVDHPSLGHMGRPLFCGLMSVFAAHWWPSRLSREQQPQLEEEKSPASIA